MRTLQPFLFQQGLPFGASRNYWRSISHSLYWLMSILAQVRETSGWCQCEISQLSWMFVLVTSPLFHTHLFCISLWLLDVTMRGLSNRLLSVCQPSKSGKTWALDIFIFLYLVWHDVNQGRPVSFSGVYKSSNPHLMHNHGHNASIMVVLQVFQHIEGCVVNGFPESLFNHTNALL